MKSLWTAAAELQKQDRAFVVVTMVSSRGSAPQDPGAKAIVTTTGLYWGTVGGGKIEARAIDYSRELLVSGQGVSGRREPVLVTWNLQTEIGMSCGGEVTFLFELHHSSAWRIAVFGAGHVGQAVVRTLAPLESFVTCIDSRTEWLDRLPVADNLFKLHVAESWSAVERFDEETYFVVMTQGHATDRPVLENIFRLFPQAPYIGVMGSAVKSKKLRRELIESGISDTLVARLRSPIGLPLGGSHPFEIAISVAGELLQVRERARVLPAAGGKKDAGPSERDTEQTFF